MGTFYDVDGGFSSMTEEQLDAKAREGGRLCSIGYSYACRGHNKPRHGYAAVWIATGGMGNCGVLILRGLTPAKRELIRVGKAEMLMRTHGISFDVAATVVAVGHLEHAVVAFAISELGNPAWDYFDEGHRARWAAEFQVDVPAGMSCPRLSKVAEIVRRLRRSVCV